MTKKQVLEYLMTGTGWIVAAAGGAAYGSQRAVAEHAAAGIAARIEELAFLDTTHPMLFIIPGGILIIAGSFRRNFRKAESRRLRGPFITHEP